MLKHKPNKQDSLVEASMLPNRKNSTYIIDMSNIRSFVLYQQCHSTLIHSNFKR